MITNVQKRIGIIPPKVLPDVHRCNHEFCRIQKTKQTNSPAPGRWLRQDAMHISCENKGGEEQIVGTFSSLLYRRRGRADAIK